KLDWELTWMNRFLHVVVLHVGNDPNVAGILSERVARILTLLGAFERLLPRILLRHTDRVEIEHVVVAFGEPDDVFIAAREAVLAMQPVLEAPDDTVSELHAERLTNAVDED